MNNTKILSIPIACARKTELYTLLDTWLSQSTSRKFIVTANPEILLHANRDKNYTDILLSADLIVPDGFGITLVNKLKRGPRMQRLTGVSLTHHLLQTAEQSNQSVAFLLKQSGFTSKETLNHALKKQYPALSYHLSYDTEPISEISAFQPTIILIGLGAPQQEYWIKQHISTFESSRLILGVGGTFDFISGTIQRAPVFLQHLGLEWLWRLIRQPNRIGRIIRATIIFPYKALIKK